MYDLDMLTAAWGWSQDQVAAVLRADAVLLRTWRHRDASMTPAAVERIAKLQSSHFSLWQPLAPGAYARWWRHPNAGLIGRTAIEVAVEEPGLEKISGARGCGGW